MQAVEEQGRNQIELFGITRNGQTKLIAHQGQDITVWLTPISQRHSGEGIGRDERMITFLRRGTRRLREDGTHVDFVPTNH